MAFLSFLRSSRTGAAAVLLGSVGFIATAGAFGACGKEAPAADSTADADTTTIARTPSWGYEVVATHPHDTSSFTEGLFFHEGRLFESTGEVGTSYIREVELTTGRAIRQRDLAPPYFGEGTIVFGDKLYQLTWTSGKAFVYDWKTFKPTGEFTYDGEGWALTTDGTSLIMSNGTPMIRWRDPKTFAVTDSISVTDHGTAVTSLNELEWVKGEIWANVWQSEQIARIDPKTGVVTGWIDLSGILKAIDRTGREDVLNGIAYDAANDRYYVTGKRWAKLFEIKLKRRG
ncbi:MAG: glutaminyl-peptide cyclotransferase [Gemmatimonadaceae bacterium]|jgi:glutamine cyclotransferase|nr:glutaminyl-peptide cyclotransferase [Gemmatimonadaceae bacterium]MCC6432966.1 glutaminyl-peptide cyclotransferase [Gemmatimonadaceae bacterium]